MTTPKERVKYYVGQSSLIIRILYFLGIMRIYHIQKDDRGYDNFGRGFIVEQLNAWNPLTWVFLVVVCFLVGICKGIIEMVKAWIELWTNPFKKDISQR